MEIPKCLTLTLKREQKLALVPFFAAWLIYFILYMPVLGYPPATLSSVFFKILPILSLCYYVISADKDFKTSISDFRNIRLSDPLRGNVLIGLLFSVLGDACLVWRDALFIPGLLFFAVAQLCYVIGFHADLDDIKSRTKSVFVMAAMCIFLILKSGIDSIILLVLVMMYTTLIFTMAWMATARFETLKTTEALAGLYGAFCFVFSDLIIAVDKWCFGVPFAPSIIMSSYYIAQLGIALSATKTQRVTEN